MRRYQRFISMGILGGVSGLIAAFVAYAVRGPEKVNLDEMAAKRTLSDEPWAIVGLFLLGALVCGTITAANTLRKGIPRMVASTIFATLLGGGLSWGSRYAMDLMIRAGRDSGGFPYMLWQLGVAAALTFPIAIAVGANRHTLLRAAVGSALVIGIGTVVIVPISVIAVGLLLGGLAAKQDPSQVAMQIARIADSLYLFSMGLAAGLAFAIADTLIRPAWLTSRSGMTEGRKWSIHLPVNRVGAAEGVEVRLPPDPQVAPVHCQVQSQDERHYLVDFTGAVLLNGQLVGPSNAWLKDGDAIQVGPNQLIYRTHLSGPVGVAAPPSGIELPVVPTNQPASQPTALAVPVAVELVLLDPMGKHHRLKVGVNTVGRDPASDVALTWEQSVSRHHAELVVSADGAVTVRDLGSTNGTFLEDHRITRPETLTRDAKIAFGKAKVTLL